MMGKAQDWILGILLLAGLGGPAAAQVDVDVDVSNVMQLLQAINDANDDVGAMYTITFTDDITLDQTLFPLAPAEDITFDGAGHTISGDDQFQIFFVDSGNVDINQLTFVEGRSQGGDGGAGRSGGGMGAGGALFVNETAEVRLTTVLFRADTARSVLDPLDGRVGEVH